MWPGPWAWPPAACRSVESAASLTRSPPRAARRQAVPAPARSASTSPSSRRALLVTSPAARSGRRWCETRFSARSATHARSQTHSSPPSPRATASISRVGSESAFASAAARSDYRAAQPPRAHLFGLFQVDAKDVATIVGHDRHLMPIEMSRRRFGAGGRPRGAVPRGKGLSRGRGVCLSNPQRRESRPT
jgi:hypothetical protein